MLSSSLDCLQRKQFPLTSEQLDLNDEKLLAVKKPLRCHICETVITDNSTRIEINGSNIHTRKNPAGITFTFACFYSAPGCNTWGEPSAEFTWFRGCRWQIAICGHCGEHLGWLFRNGKTFYALIINRLISD